MLNKEKKENLFKKLESENVYACYITCDENVFYFSGFDGGESFLVLTEKKNYLLTDFRYSEQAEKQADGFEVVEYSRGQKNTIVSDLIAKAGVKNLGVEKGDITALDYEQIKHDVSVDGFTDISGHINDIRSIKYTYELDLIKKAAAVSDEAFLKLIKQIKIGMTEMDIFTELNYLFNKAGCQQAFTPIIASGPNSALPHAPLTNRKIEDGDLLTIDFGAKLDSYCSDCTRTIGIGGLDNAQKKVYYVVSKAQELALAAIKDGVMAADIDKIARDYINDAGFEGCFGHGLGHGLGLFVHEGLRLGPTSKDVLKKNMVFSVEPGVYLKGKYGVRIEDIGTITDDGFEIFNSLYKDLIII